MNRQLKVLLLAEEPHVTRHTQAALCEMGHYVRVMKTLKQDVLSSFGSSKPDVILIYTGLGVEGDLAAMGEAISLRQDLPIVFIKDTNTNNKLDPVRANVHGYLTQPFTEDELGRALQQATSKELDQVVEDKTWLNTLINSSRAAMLALDENMRITFMNNRAKEMSGCSEENLHNCEFDRLFSINTYPPKTKAIPVKTLLQKCHELDPHYLVTNRKNTNYIAQLDINRIQDGGIHKGQIVIIRDVTENHENQKALETSHQRYQELVEQIPDSIYRSTPEGNLLMVNQAFVKMLGYEDVKDVLALDIANQIYYLNSDRQKVLKSYDQESIYTTTIRLRKKDGSLIWAEEHGRKVLNEDGEIAYYEGVIRDITQRKQTETILKNIAEGVSAETGSAFFKSLVKHLSKSLNIDYAMVCEIISTQKEARVIAQQGMNEVYKEGDMFTLQNTPWQSVLSNDDITCYKSGLQQHFPDNGSLIALGVNSFMGIPLYDSNKRLIGHLAILDKEPLTTNLVLIENMVRIFAIRAAAELERKHFERKLVVEKERAEEMNRLKTNFLANMSHEIRTPMNSILGFTTLLEEQLNDTELDYFTSRIKKSGERLLTTINDLLDLAKIESSKTELTLGYFNIGEQTEIAAGLLNGIAIQKSIKLFTTIKKKSVFAHIDANVMGQILNNTIGNALKFTEKGEVEVTVDTAYVNGEDYARICVRDTGIGIGKDFLPQVFDEFKQESHGLSRRYEGTGLGLTITKKFIEMQNGCIEVESTKTVGTTITMLFPLVTEPSVIGNGHDDEPPAPTSDSQKEPKLKILLVEDNDENKDVTTLILKNHFIIDSALDGQSALEQARENEYSVILMDINLGRGMDGSEVKDAIRQMPNYEDVPVIAITAYAMRGDRDKYLLEGFDDYLAKPFSKEELVEVITNSLSGNQVNTGNI